MNFLFCSHVAMSVTTLTLSDGATTIDVITSVDAHDPNLAVVKVGSGLRCVGIDIDLGEGVADIELLRHAETCARPTLKKSDGGTVPMLKAVMQHIRSAFPAIQRFTLQDASHIPCDGDDQSSLMYVHIQLRGKTWYEDKFGAVLEDEDDMATYKACIRLLGDPAYYADNKATAFRSDADAVVKALASASVTTFRELFEAVHKEAPSQYCRFANALFTPFVERLFATKKLFPILWHIPAATVDGYGLSGGRRGDAKSYPKPTRDTVTHNGAKHRVYVGARGGRYVQLRGGAFVSVKRV